MSGTLKPEQAQREAEVRAKLPDDCTKLLTRHRLTPAPRSSRPQPRGWRSCAPRTRQAGCA